MGLCDARGDSAAAPGAAPAAPPSLVQNKTPPVDHSEALFYKPLLMNILVSFISNYLHTMPNCCLEHLALILLAYYYHPAGKYPSSPFFPHMPHSLITWTAECACEGAGSLISAGSFSFLPFSLAFLPAVCGVPEVPSLALTRSWYLFFCSEDFFFSRALCLGSICKVQSSTMTSQPGINPFISQILLKSMDAIFEGEFFLKDFSPHALTFIPGLNCVLASSTGGETRTIDVVTGKVQQCRGN